MQLVEFGSAAAASQLFQNLGPGAAYGSIGKIWKRWKNLGVVGNFKNVGKIWKICTSKNLTKIKIRRDTSK